MAFKNLSDLKKHINKQIESTLINEVAQTIREVEIINIQSEVYNAYEPKKYVRRYENGGLSDPSNIEAFSSTNGNSKSLLEVYNTTPYHPYIYINGHVELSQNIDNPTSLAELIEYGNGYENVYYDFQYDREYMRPRPFTQSTIRELTITKKHIESLKTGLENRGLNVT